MKQLTINLKNIQATPAAQFQKDKWPNQKMGQRTKHNSHIYTATSYANAHVAAAAKSLQSCLTLCDPIDGSPLGSPVPGILQAKTLEWVAISFSSAWKWKVKVKSLSCVRPSATPWTAAFQAPPSMGFSRQEYWSGVPLPSPLLPLNRWILWYANCASTSYFK